MPPTPSTSSTAPTPPTPDALDAPPVPPEWDTLDAPEVPGRGVRVASVAELEAAGGVISVRVDGVPWAIVRLDGVLAAFLDRCPHRRVPLSEGSVVPTETGAALECPYHGWSFAPDGQCVRIPALGAQTVPKGMRVSTAQVTEHAGEIWLSTPS